MRRRPSPSNFQYGELAPWLDGISNDVTQNAGRTVENFIVRKSGAASRRPGTFFVREAQNSAKTTVLIPVTIDADQSFVLEVGDTTINFFRQSDHSLVEAEDGLPWSAGEVSALRWAYVASEKALYVAHSKHPLHKIFFVGGGSPWEHEVVDMWTQPPWVLAHNSQKRVFLLDGFLDEPEEVQANINPSKQIEFFHGVYHGNNYAGLTRFYEEGETSSSKGQIIVSPEGKIWSGTVEDEGFNAVAAAQDFTGTRHHRRLFATNQQGRIMLPTESGALWSSEDHGLTWASHTLVAKAGTEHFDVVGYSADNNSWRAIHNKAGGALQAFYSADGYSSWLSVAAPFASGVRGEIGGLIGENNLWVAWTRQGAGGVESGTILTASTGQIAQGFSVSYQGVGIQDVAYGTPGGQPYWLAITASQGNTHVLASSQGDAGVGLAWTTVASPGARFDQIAWTGSRFIAIEGSPSGTIWWSSDRKGDYWAPHADSPWGDPGMDNLNVLVSSGTLKGQPVFGASGTYPSVIAVNEGRLTIAASVNKPSHIWGSKTGHWQNFFLGETAEKAFEYEIAGSDNVDIQWIVGGNELVVGTRTAEGVLRGERGIGITPTAAAFLWQSNFGSRPLQPVRVGDHIIFAQRGGEVIRGFVPAAGTEAWKSPDLTAVADHIAEGGVTEIDYQDDPFSLIWFVRADGQLLSCTFDGTRAAWSRHVTYTKADGGALTQSAIESIAVVPTSGNEDEVWMIVNRTIGGSTKRYIEYLDKQKFGSLADAHCVDSGVEVSSGVNVSTVGGLTHLSGQEVDATIDGNYVASGLVVSGTGTITLPVPGKQIHAGLRYPSYLQTMRPDPGSPWGAGVGLSQYPRAMQLWVHESIGGAVGPTVSITEALSYGEALSYDTATDLTTDILAPNFPGDWGRDNYMWVVMTDPLPITVVAYARDVEVGDD